VARTRPAQLLSGVAVAGFGLARWSLRTFTAVAPPAYRIAATAAGRARADADRVARVVLTRVVTGTLGAIDLTKVVRENVDLNAVAEDIDVAAIVERVDLTDVVRRVDVAGVARQVVEEVDLPSIVRESSGALASEAVAAARVRAKAADDLITRVPDTAPPHRPAGFVTRLAGAALDASAAGVLAVLAYLGFAGLRFMVWPAAFRWPHPPVPVSLAAVGLIAVAYLATGWVATGRTLGGSVFGYRVLAGDRTLLGWPRAGARAVLCVVFPIGLALAVIGPARRSLADLVLRSTVRYDWHHGGGFTRAG